MYVPQLYDCTKDSPVNVTGCTDVQAEDEGKESFLNLAGEDGEIDAYELRDILNSVFIRGDLLLTLHECHMI